MKPLSYGLLILFNFCVFSKQLLASHLGPGYVTYEYTGITNEYKISIHHIQDCGAVFPTGTGICYYSLSAGISGTLILQNTDIDTIPYISCGGTLGYCTGGNPIVKISNWGIVTLPVAAPDWIFSYDDCCMDININNILSPGSYGINVYASLDNLNSPGNSSPQFNDSLYYEYCIGNLSLINYSCYDPDGDSLVYSLIPAHDNSGCPAISPALNYAPGFSALNPISSFTPITFSQTNGILEFTPKQLEIDIVSVQVDEYRNGNLISTITREDRITSGLGYQNPDLIKGKVYYDLNSNGILDPNEPGISGINVVAQPFGFFATTDSNGNYTVLSYFGNYTVSIANMPKYCHSSPLTHTAIFTALGQTDSLNDFAIIPDSIVTDISLYGPSHLMRPCDTTSWQITVHNSGTDTSGSVLFANIPSIFNVNYTVPPADSVSGNSFWWNILPMIPGQTNNYTIHFTVDCSIPAGTNFCDSAIVTTTKTDAFPSDNVVYFCGTIVSSCDPNYKVVSESIISPSFVSNQDWLYYTIHFQNIGNAPALVVDIKDAIDHDLEAGSLELISTSHPCVFNLTSTGLADFYFPNINLPDSTSNEPDSHGFVQYRLKPKANLQSGDLIHNGANIYFDFNAPVATNITETSVGGLSSIHENTPLKSFCRIYPNPYSGTFTLLIEGNENDIYLITIKDILGRTVSATRSVPAGNEVQLGENLIAGIYFVELVSRDKRKVLRVEKM